MRELSGNESLRSILYYSKDERDVVFMRDDVAGQNSDTEIEAVFDHLWMESFGSPTQEDLFVHDGLRCIVTHFEDAVEMNFIIGDQTGISVAFDGDAFTAQQSFVNECYEILAEG